MDHDHCKICNKLLNKVLADHYRRELTTGTCFEKPCMRQDEINQGKLCCDKAQYIECVCARAYQCPEHHPLGVHHGTHD